MVLHGFTGCLTVFHGVTRKYIDVVARCYTVFYGGTRCHRVLQGFTKCYTVLQGASRCFMVLPEP